MKKLLIAMVLGCFCLPGIAQDKVTHEQAKAITANTMANFTESVSFAYNKGISLREFKKTLCGKAVPLDAGNGMIETAYNYLSKGTTKDEIINEDDGLAVARVLKYLSEKYDKGVEISDGSEIFGGKESLGNSTIAKAEGCKWYQFWCHVHDFADWVVANWPVILEIITFILTHL